MMKPCEACGVPFAPMNPTYRYCRDPRCVRRRSRARYARVSRPWLRPSLTLSLVMIGLLAAATPIEPALVGDAEWQIAHGEISGVRGLEAEFLALDAFDERVITGAASGHTFGEDFGFTRWRP